MMSESIVKFLSFPPVILIRLVIVGIMIVTSIIFMILNYVDFIANDGSDIFALMRTMVGCVFSRHLLIVFSLWELENKGKIIAMPIYLPMSIIPNIIFGKMLFKKLESTGEEAIENEEIKKKREETERL